MRLRHALLVAPALLVAGAAIAAKPVEVTRFHTPATLAQLRAGGVTVAPAPGIDGNSLEARVWLDAVARALGAQGFVSGSTGAARIAEVRITRDTSQGSGGSGSPVSVGVGLGTGSGGWYRGGSHFGLGVGLGLGGGSGRGGQIASELSVVIRDAATRAPLWEGRAVTRARAGSKDAAPARAADHLARALFAGFPGRSGETIEVR